MSSNANKNVSKEDKAMSTATDPQTAQRILRDVWSPQKYGSVQAALYEAHRYISRRVQKEFTVRRARAIREGKARRIDAEELDVMRQAEIEDMRNEQKALRARLASLDEMLSRSDEAFHSETLAALREQAR